MDMLTKLLVEKYNNRNPNAYLVDAPVHITDLAKIVEEQDEKIIKLEQALRRCIEWLDNAPFDYSNGNSACGVDEGNVRGWDGHREIINNAKLALGDILEERLK